MKTVAMVSVLANLTFAWRLSPILIITFGIQRRLRGFRFKSRLMRLSTMYLSGQRDIAVN